MDRSKFFSVSDSVCRGHSFKLCKQNIQLNVKKFFFTRAKNSFEKSMQCVET